MLVLYVTQLTTGILFLWEKQLKKTLFSQDMNVTVMEVIIFFFLLITAKFFSDRYITTDPL